MLQARIRLSVLFLRRSRHRQRRFIAPSADSKAMAKQTKGSGPAAERWYETNETYAGSVVDATKAIKKEDDDEEKGGEEVSTFFLPPTRSYSDSLDSCAFAGGIVHASSDFQDS